MKFLNYLKNLFTGFRPYNFTNKHSQEKQQKSYLSQQTKSPKQKKFIPGK